MIFLALIDSDESVVLEQVYKEQSKKYLGIAYAVLKDFHEAQDVVQLSFEKLVKNRKAIDLTDKDRVVAYLYTVVRNQAIDVYKRKKKIEYTHDTDYYRLANQDEISIDKNLLELEKREEITKKLDLINHRYSTVLTLKYYLDLSNQEIAKSMDCSELNVRVLLHRARQSLKKILTNEVELNNE